MHALTWIVVAATLVFATAAGVVIATDGALAPAPWAVGTGLLALASALRAEAVAHAVFAVNAIATALIVADVRSGLVAYAATALLLLAVVGSAYQR